MTNEDKINYLKDILSEINENDNAVCYLTSEDSEVIESAIKALEQARWIPVSERLPKPRIDVWCNSDMGQMVGYYDEYVETWYGRDYLELMVTAWMPLPEPYEP
jgi:hypothetical protein